MSRSLPEAAPSRARVEALLRLALDDERLGRDEALELASALGDDALRAAVLGAALESKRRGKGDAVTFSRNVFLPITNLCRDRCAYCTFAKLPDDPAAKTYELAEVADVVRGAVRAGCIEALLCLGDKPEVAYRTHRDWLRVRGFASTAEYLVEACRVAFEGGMLPHTNAGVLSKDEMAALRPWNASMGLMLETTSERLRARGGAHYYAPDKEPARRIRMHEEAGELGIPFTTGLLLGIGETAAERVDTLLTIRSLSDRYGHIQETIVQPFHPKPGTPMRDVRTPANDEVAGWVALARLVLGPHANVQAPPNLAPDALELLLSAGLNDWGGVSPVTIDFINPEAPWPALRELRERTEAAGAKLRERLPAYPADVAGRPELFDPQILAALRRLADESGHARRRDGARQEAA